MSFFLAFSAESQERMRFEERDLIIENGNAMRSGGHIVLILHGRGERPDNMLRMEMLSEATRRHATLVYPSSSDHRTPRIWRDGRHPFREGNEDTLYLQRLITHLSRNGENKIFIIGASSGAMMAYRMICEVPEMLEGVIAMIGNMPEPLKDTCNARRNAVRFMAINGDRDEVVSIHGGLVCSVGLPGCSGGRVLSFYDSLEIMSGINRCRGGMGRPIRYVNSTRNGEAMISVAQGAGCEEQTVGIIVHGMTHEWPIVFFENAGWNAKSVILDYLFMGLLPKRQE
jgi:polyhydroxybutyrate depolymerase